MFELTMSFTVFNRPTSNLNKMSIYNKKKKKKKKKKNKSAVATALKKLV